MLSHDKILFHMLFGTCHHTPCIFGINHPLWIIRNRIPSLNSWRKKNDDLDRSNRSSVDLLDNCKMLDCEEESIDHNQIAESKPNDKISFAKFSKFSYFFKTYCQTKIAEADIIPIRIIYVFSLKNQSWNTFQFILAKKH